MKNFHLAIIGASGKLGKTVVQSHDLVTEINSSTNKCDIPFESIDVFLDVSTKEAILHYLPEIRAQKTPLVVGSTGLSSKTKDILYNLHQELPVLIAPNFSRGIYLLKKALQNINHPPSQIEEIHHKHKKDIPSGTATMLASMYDPCPKITSIREDDVKGIHTIKFSLEEEDLEITHKAKSRDIFAIGAIKACSFLYKKGKGFYTMDDVYRSCNERE